MWVLEKFSTKTGIYHANTFVGSDVKSRRPTINVEFPALFHKKESALEFVRNDAPGAEIKWRTIGSSTTAFYGEGSENSYYLDERLPVDNLHKTWGAKVWN